MKTKELLEQTASKFVNRIIRKMRARHKTPVHLALSLSTRGDCTMFTFIYKCYLAGLYRGYRMGRKSAKQIKK